MQALLQSAFLQVLANALIASIWQMALLWLFVATVFKLFKFTPSIKFKIAFAAQLTGFILFICTALNVYYNYAEAITINAIQAGFITTLNKFINATMPYATVAYLVILLFKLSRLFFAFKETRHLKKYGIKKIPAAQRIFVQQVAELFSLHRKVSIYLSEKIICPLTTGFLKPVILIPVAAINHLTTEQLEAVILHELAHIKRADYLLYAMQVFIEKIFFFNIFSIMLGEILEREREMACDEWVLQFRYNNMQYAEALFKMGRLKAMPALAMPLQGKKESLLLVRIKKILHHPQQDKYNFPTLMMGLMSIIIMAGLLISSQIKNPSKEKANTAATAVRLNNHVQNINFQSPPAVVISKTSQIKKVIKEEISKALVRGRKSSEKITDIKKPALKPEVLAQPYVYQVYQPLDSLNHLLSAYQPALNTQSLLTEKMQQKAISYQNFKRLEEMLTASGYSINITEKDSVKNSYKKLLTVQATDKQGNKHIYNVEVELFQ